MKEGREEDERRKGGRRKKEGEDERRKEGRKTKEDRNGRRKRRHQIHRIKNITTADYFIVLYFSELFHLCFRQSIVME
jgi:hypothetical protein